MAAEISKVNTYDTVIYNTIITFTFTTDRADSAEDKTVDIFLIFPRK